ncbi:uncharacterized protein LOC134813414 [Bolinopsis microptera]|uniref:uncharacterized protein LOC134813414 n=1 Tax=Bolinopsis microptera TaxID=2820187 RepID=UPI003079A027
MIFPIDVVPVFCGTVFTTLSNTYVISELAKSYRTPIPSQQTRDTFCKTTLLIVLLTSLFLLCYIPTLVFYFLNSLETLTDSKLSFISSIPGQKSFITLFSIKFLIPTLYPALGPALQFCGTYRQRERQRRATSFFIKMRPSRLNSTFAMWRRATRSTQVMGQSLTMPDDQQNSPQFTHTPL